MLNGTAILENNLAVFLKARHKTTTQTSTFTPSIYPKEIKTCSHKDLHKNTHNNHHSLKLEILINW